jgi:5-methylcytosine-specific restriction endonuclease McrA
MVIMHVPRAPHALVACIRDLIKQHKLYLFYKSPEWLSLRDEVLREAHYECEECKEKSPSIYSQAVTVHHEMEVKDHPELALSKTYRDGQGNVKRNLVALCARCHNEKHHRFRGNIYSKAPLTEERFD